MGGAATKESILFKMKTGLSNHLVFNNYRFSAMNSIVLTIYEANKLLEIIHSLVSIEDSIQFREIALSLIDLLEFDFIIFGLPERTDFGGTQEAIVDLNITYPQNRVDLYEENDFWRIDPVLLASREKCALQRPIDRNRNMPRKKGFLGLARDFGLKDGLTCLNRGGRLAWKKISMGGAQNRYKNRNKNKREEYILERLTPHFHLALSTLMAKNAALKLQSILTKRECEVLRWLSQGKTSWEISVILGVAEVTINFHIKNINIKLGTVNRSHAVAVAAQSGLVGDNWI